MPGAELAGLPQCRICQASSHLDTLSSIICAEYLNVCISLGMLDGLQEVLSNDTGRNEQGSGAQVCWAEQRKEGYHSLPGIVDVPMNKDDCKKAIIIV